MKLEGRERTLAVKPGNLTPESLNPGKLRFGLGDRVACNCTNEGWERGKVVQLLYGEMGRVYPYQVLLDNGRYIFAPADDDDLIRRPSDAPVEDKSRRLKISSTSPSPGRRKFAPRMATSPTSSSSPNLQNRLPRARVVYCSATSVSHQKNLGFMARLGLWGPGTESPSGFHQFLDRLKLLKTGASRVLDSVG